eukprot:m.25931 g.25931  ORF g.25931 m.25931 type:complete len:158 (+) comp29021_c0_seq1:444-917(+)
MDQGKEAIEDLLQPQLQMTDFGGEDIYRSFHRLFLRPKGIYLIVSSFRAFDMQDKDAYNKDEIQDVMKWLKWAHKYGGEESKTFLVCTHRDTYKNAPELRRKVVAELNDAVQKSKSPLRKFVFTNQDEPSSSIFQIENSGSRSDPALVDLRKRIQNP